MLESKSLGFTPRKIFKAHNLWGTGRFSSSRPGPGLSLPAHLTDTEINLKTAEEKLTIRDRNVYKQRMLHRKLCRIRCCYVLFSSGVMTHDMEEGNKCCHYCSLCFRWWLECSSGVTPALGRTQEDSCCPGNQGVMCSTLTQGGEWTPGTCIIMICTSENINS